MCVARQPFAAAVRNIDGGMLVVVLRMILIMMMVRMITLVVMKSPHFTIFSNMIRLTLEVHLRHLLVVSSPTANFVTAPCLSVSTLAPCFVSALPASALPQLPSIARYCYNSPVLLDIATTPKYCYVLSQLPSIATYWYIPCQCTMGLSVALRIWNIWKCKGLGFAMHCFKQSISFILKMKVSVC